MRKGGKSLNIWAKKNRSESKLKSSRIRKEMGLTQEHVILIQTSLPKLS